MSFRDQTNPPSSSSAPMQTAPSHTLASDYVLPLSPVQAQHNVLNIFDIVALVLRQVKWLVLGCMIAVLLGFVYLAVTEPAYRSSTLLLIDPRESAPVGIEGQNLPQNPDPFLVESQLLLIKSVPVLERMVRELDLQNTPEARPGFVGTVVNVIKSLLIAKVDTSEDARVFQLVKEFSKDIKIKRPERTYTLEILIKAGTPEMAVAISDALVRAYFAEQRAISDRTFDARANWVDGQIDLFGKRLSAAEQAIQDYRVSNNLLDTAAGPVAYQQLDATAAELATARATANIAKARWTQVRALVSSGRGYEALSRDTRSTLFDTLVSDLAALEQQRSTISSTFGPRHPNFLSIEEEIATKRRQVQDELRAIAASVRVDFESAEATAVNVESQLAQLRVETLGVNQSSLALRDLERAAGAARTNYQKFLSAKDNLRKDVEIAPFVTIVSPPFASTNPVSPKLVPTMIVAIAAGLNFGIVIAVIADFFVRHRNSAQAVRAYREDEHDDSGYGAADADADGRYAEGRGHQPQSGGRAAEEQYRPSWHDQAHPEAAFEIELPEFLGTRPSRDELEFGLDLLNDQEEIGWQVHQLREVIAQSLRTHEEQTVFLTSSGERTGKTFTALMLARASAEKGENVCLFDANYDNPTLSHLGRMAGEPVLLDVGDTQLNAYRLMVGDMRGAIYVLPNVADPMTARTEFVRREFARIDMFIVDGPSAEKLADMNMLSEMSEGFVLVENGDNFSTQDVQPLVDVLGQQTRYLGVALSPN